MLYVSTRNRHDSYTAHRTLHENRAPDGGLYVPFLLPTYSMDEIAHLKGRSFSENVAVILNAFFSTKLTGWDLEFCCGRYPVKTVDLPRRLIVAEAWHNTVASYGFMEQALFTQLCGGETKCAVTNWAKIAIAISVLFAVYGSTEAAQRNSMIDLAVDCDNFIMPMAAWYARKMGLPIRMIVCGTRDNSFVWDLIHRGEMPSASATSEIIGMERLIFTALGADAALDYAGACTDRRGYLVHDELLCTLNDGLFAAVVSSDRIQSVISSFFRSHGYVLDHTAAISYGALQDYRARTGESKITLMLSLSNPAMNASELTEILGITGNELEETIGGQRG